VTILLCTPAFSSYEEFLLSPIVKESLISNKVNDRDIAINILSKDNGIRILNILSALLNGNLYVDKDTESFYIRDSDGATFLALGSGEIIPLSYVNAKKIGTNNKQREALVRIINGRSLKTPDLIVRREASKSLIAGTTLDEMTILDLMKSETDRVVLDNYKKALTVLTLKNRDSEKEDKVHSLEFLKNNFTPEAQELLREYTKNEDMDLRNLAISALASMEASVQHLALFETIFFGLSLGSVLVLIAIGLAITFGVMGVINMAHGEMVMLGAYTVWFLQTLLPGKPGLALILAIPFAFIVTGIIGVIIERGVIRFLYKRPLETLLATFGISLILH
jgi:urea transport system permease protein